MPAQAAREGWSRLERDLFLQSGGAYHAGEMARRRRVPGGKLPAGAGTGAAQQVPGRVSVVTPTTGSRQHYHEQLWGCFEAQTWPDKELVVVETYVDAPSAFFQRKAKEDDRLVYISLRVAGEEEDFTVGLKRDMTLHLASGEFVANFDDDDVYAARYAAEMVGELRARGLAAVTLSSWFNFFVRRGVCGYSEPASWGPLDQEDLEANLYGYGFSYVHRRREALALPYPNADFAEDLPFMLKLREALGDDAVLLKADEAGLCMHIVHRANSTVDPEFSRELSPEELAELEVASSPAFQRYLSGQARVCDFLGPLTQGPLWTWLAARIELAGCV